MQFSLANGSMSPDLPITIVDQSSMTMADEEMIVAFGEHMPESKFHPGDLGYLTEATSYLKQRGKTLPRLWQVRFIISMWQHELMALAHTHNGLMGIDHAHSLLQSRGMVEMNYRKPMLYCHAFPHGMYPDTAAWIPERALRKISFREQNQQWQRILDEAKAPFVGYDTSHLMAPYIYDLAPDRYSSGENLGRPFSFEEATVHTAALLGLEEVMFRPVDAYYINSNRIIDPQHDIFKGK